MIGRLIRKGYLKEDDPRFVAIKHNFGKAFKPSDFINHSDDENSCDS